MRKEIAGLYNNRKKGEKQELTINCKVDIFYPEKQLFEGPFNEPIELLPVIGISINHAFDLFIFTN